MTLVQIMLLIFALPLVASALVFLIGDRNPNLRDGAAIVTGLVTASILIYFVPQIGAGARPELLLAEILPGIDIGFRVEPLGALYAAVAGILWAPTTLYAVGYMRGHHEENQTRFFTFFPLAIFGAFGIAFSKNLVTLFLFYELLSLATYPLVTHHGNDKARRAGRIYLGILMGTSILFLFSAIVLTYHWVGTTEFVSGGILSKLSAKDAGLLFTLFAFGAGKAALMPLHRWLPNAMVAPTPVSALLHAVAVVKAGVFTILKVAIYTFGIDFLAETRASTFILWIAAGTIILSSLIAFYKDNLKERLAYSTISQLAYISLGAALGTNKGALGAALHIATHAVGKITLFFCAGAVLVAAHKKNISQLDGLGKKMPITMGAFLIAAVSIAGLPPGVGVWSKWYLAAGASIPHGEIFIGVLMLSSLLNIGYLIPIPVRAFLRPLPDDDHSHEASWQILVPIALTTSACVLLFFFGAPLVDFLSTIVGGRAFFEPTFSQIGIDSAKEFLR